MTRQYWKLPLNWEEMIEQVRWAAGGKFSLEVEAPETLALVAEQQEQLGRERKVVHLLNYSAPQGKIVSAINIEVELPEGKAVRQITLLTPDRKNRMTISGQMTGGRARFTVPHVESYTLAVLDLGPS